MSHSSSRQDPSLVTRSWFHCVRILPLVILGLLACQSRSEETMARADSGAARAVKPPVDSARAAQAALTLMQRESSWGLRVERVEQDSAGYLVTIFPEPLIPGGGGRVRVRPDGSAIIVQRFQ